MVRLWVRLDGSFVETVYVNEHPDAVARANAKLALLYPGTVGEDYSNDAYEAMRPKDGSGIERWRRQGDGIVVLPAPPTPPTLEQRIAALEARIR